ncbi:MAG: TetR/AcrR family transcriptional regulator [Myxococcota bacterium]
MAEKKKRGRPRTFERDRAVSRALDHYWREGPLALSVNEFCRRMGMSKPSLYREFGGEDGLLAEALDRYWGSVLAPIAALLGPDRSFAESTEALIAFASDPGDTPKGCLLAKSRGTRDRLGPAAGARVDELARALRNAYEAVSRRGQERGEVRSDINSEFAARYLDTQVTTALHKVAAGEDPDEVRAQTELALTALLPS